MVRVVAFIGSARKNGNVDTIVEEILKGFFVKKYIFKIKGQHNIK